MRGLVDLVVAALRITARPAGTTLVVKMVRGDNNLETMRYCNLVNLPYIIVSVICEANTPYYCSTWFLNVL